MNSKSHKAIPSDGQHVLTAGQPTKLTYPRHHLALPGITGICSSFFRFCTSTQDPNGMFTVDRMLDADSLSENPRVGEGASIVDAVNVCSGWSVELDAALKNSLEGSWEREEVQ